MAQEKGKPDAFRKAVVWAAFSLCLCVSAVNLSCGSKVTDMRTLVPAETLVYLETNDLAAALQPIVDSKPFTEVAKSKPDFSALKGVQLAVAVTGFETSEEKLTDEHSVGRVQPHFVAVADTHAWNYQAVAFAEKKLGSFVTEIYDSEPKLERSDKNGGKYFTWTATDGRKAFALVIDSIIYFGNDETAIDKCLAVKRGEADNIAKAGTVQLAAPGTLARGYIFTDGIAQISNVIGMKLASEATDESEIQSAIAGILPILIRSAITDVTWTMTKGEQGIEDKYQIEMPADVANVFSETAKPAGTTSADMLAKVPKYAVGVTVYNFDDPKLAWRSVLSLSQKLTDPLAGKAFGETLSLFFEPYGIRDPLAFFGTIRRSLVTVKADFDHDGPFVIAHASGLNEFEKFIDADVKLKKDPWTGTNFKKWQSDEGDLAAASDGSVLIIGDKDGVAHCVGTGKGEGFDATPQGEFLNRSNASVVTFGYDIYPNSFLTTLASDTGGYTGTYLLTYSTETRFTKTGMERKTVSDFGLIGSIIVQLNAE